VAERPGGDAARSGNMNRVTSRAHRYDLPPMRTRWLTYAFLVIVAIGAGVVASGLPTRGKDPVLRAEETPANPAPAAARTTVTSTRPAATTSTTTRQAHAPAAVTVLVANGTEVDGAATRRGDQLRSRGYVVLTPVDAEDASAQTRVFYAINGEADARAIASTFGAPTDAVAPLPDPLPVADLQSANVLVVVGEDLANA
jgi:hypothetical protein